MRPVVWVCDEAPTASAKETLATKRIETLRPDMRFHPLPSGSPLGISPADYERHYLLQQSRPPQQGIESGVGTERVPHVIVLEINDHPVPLHDCFVEPGESTCSRVYVVVPIFMVTAENARAAQARQISGLSGEGPTWARSAR